MAVVFFFYFITCNLLTIEGLQIKFKFNNIYLFNMSTIISGKR